MRLNYSQIESAVRLIAGELRGRLSVRVEEPLAAAGWGYGADEQVASASVIKLLIAWEALARAASGSLDLSARATINPKQLVGGAGVLRLFTHGQTVTWRDLVTLMLVVSDNSATNLLIERLTMEAINARATGLGLSRTVLQRRMMDVAARQRGEDNLMSAADAARLLSQAVLAHDAGDPQAWTLLRTLGDQQFNQKLPLLIPGIPCAHKTGELPGLEHDAGVIYLIGADQSPYPVVVSVFTDQLAQNADGALAVARVGRAVVDAFVG